MKQAKGTITIKVLLVKFCARAKENLFSITQELSKGAKLDSDVVAKSHSIGVLRHAMDV